MERDYILRIIEAWGAIWRGVMRARELGGAAKGLEALDTGYEELFGGNARYIHLLAEEDLLALCERDGRPDPERAEVLGAMLTAEGDLWAELHAFDESRACYERALVVYNARYAMRLANAEAQTLLAAAVARVERYDRTLPGQHTLAMALTNLGRLADAEEALFDWMAAQDYAPAAAQALVAWYTTVSGLDDAALQAGDLLRTDVVAGLAHLRSLAVP